MQTPKHVHLIPLPMHRASQVLITRSKEIDPDRVRRDFYNTPWTEWEDASLRDTILYVSNSKFIHVPEEWKSYLPQEI